jgi:hypothetical protein
MTTTMTMRATLGGTARTRMTTTRTTTTTTRMTTMRGRAMTAMAAIPVHIEVRTRDAMGREMGAVGITTESRSIDVECQYGLSMCIRLYSRDD